MDNTISLNAEIKDLLSLYAEIKNRIKDIIFNEIKDCKTLDGVKITSPNTCIVSLKTLMHEKNWSPEMYHNDIAVKHILSYLFPENTKIENVIEKLHNMAEKGRYKDKQTTEYLNKNMLAIIKKLDSEFSDIF